MELNALYLQIRQHSDLLLEHTQFSSWGVENSRKHIHSGPVFPCTALIDTITQSSVQKKSVKKTTLNKIDSVKKSVLASVRNDIWDIVIPYYSNRNVRHMRCRVVGFSIHLQGIQPLQGRLNSDLGEFADFTLTTALRT